MRYSDSELLKAARRRATGHNGKRHIRPLVADAKELGHWWIGLVGERAFAERFDLPLNLEYYEGASDSRIDFVLPSGYTVDVKTASKPYGLWVEAYKPMADIFVLALFFRPNKAELLGWAWKSEVLRSPKTYSSYGVLNHCLTIGELHVFKQDSSEITPNSLDDRG